MRVELGQDFGKIVFLWMDEEDHIWAEFDSGIELEVTKLLEEN